jgi:Ala-tRNA(Pro) deacylase
MQQPNLQSFLDSKGVAYRLSQHPEVYTSQRLAEVEHVPGEKVIKPVVVEADGQILMCALPATHRIDLDELRRQLEADRVRLVDEPRLGELFPDCELGAEPPIGSLFGMSTVMDASLTHDDYVTFQAGTHRQAITMSLMEYRRVAQPEIAHFARHV